MYFNKITRMGQVHLCLSGIFFGMWLTIQLEVHVIAGVKCTLSPEAIRRLILYIPWTQEAWRPSPRRACRLWGRFHCGVLWHVIMLMGCFTPAASGGPAPEQIGSSYTKHSVSKSVHGAVPWYMPTVGTQCQQSGHKIDLFIVLVLWF